MARAGIDKNRIIELAAKKANENGLENVTLKMLADELGVKTPSLYNHIDSLENLKKQLMLYGWKQMENQLVRSAVGVSGYEALRVMCHTFFEYATANPGIFNAMLWYNKFENDETMGATDDFFSVFFKITKSLHISEENTNHLIRTFRGFLEGFSLLVNNGAFGNPIPLKESFDLSVDVFIEGMKTLEGK